MKNVLIVLSIASVGFLVVLGINFLKSSPLSKSSVLSVKHPGRFNYIAKPGNNGLTTSLGKTSDSTLVEVKKDNNKVLFSQPLVNPVLAQENNKKISYKNTDNDNQITYQITDKGIKEEIILVSKENIQYVFTYELNLGNMTLVRGLNNSYHFIDQTTKKPNFTIPPPFMTDAKGVKSEEIQMFHRVRNNKDYLELIADKNWLTDPDGYFLLLLIRQ